MESYFVVVEANSETFVGTLDVHDENNVILRDARRVEYDAVLLAAGDYEPTGGTSLIPNIVIRHYEYVIRPSEEVAKFIAKHLCLGGDNA